MKGLVLVDTSVFVTYLRGDSPDDTLSVLVLNNQVLLSPVVRLELLAGVRKSDLKAIEKLCNALRPVDSFAPPEDCEKLLARARGSGLLAGIPDILILADALRYQALLFSYDAKMVKLAQKLGVHVIGRALQ